MMEHRIAYDEKEGAVPRQNTTQHRPHLTPQKQRLLVVLGLENFATTIEAVRADMVTQMCFASGWLNTQLRRDQKIVRTVHTALGGGLLILLDCHDDS